MNGLKVACFFIFLFASVSSNAVEVRAVTDVVTSVIYLGEDTQKETYDLILDAQAAWMISSKKDCDAQISDVGASSARSELYNVCMSGRYLERKKYLAQYACGAGAASDEPCSKEADLAEFISTGKEAGVFSKRLRDVLFVKGQLDKVKTLALLDSYVANTLVLGGVITPATAPAFNDIGYAMSEAGALDGAYIVLSEVERQTPDRLVLKLNLADTLWGLNQRDKAKAYYQRYSEGMEAAGKISSIPARVSQRFTRE